MALRRIKADLHVHTCLSPCSGLDMSPREVVNAALQKGIDLIGVCDHNSAENVLAVKKAGRRNGLMVLGGMEVASSEEAHILVFFDDDEDLLNFQKYIYRHLTGRNDEHSFGLQVIADDEDGVTGFCDRLLIAATSLPAETISAAAREAKGESLVIAAHVDRESFSIIGQLGFIPPGLGLDAVEISGRMTAVALAAQHPECGNYPVITSSDAHGPGDIGKRFTWLTVEDGTIAEIKKALAGREAGRRSAEAMEDISLHILDIAENAVRAGAKKIEIIISREAGILRVEVNDDGRGMDAATLARVRDPFFTTKHKKTGLGIPLLSQAAEQAGGNVTVDSAPGRGTRVAVTFPWNHVDRPPVGSMAETVLTLIAGHSDREYIYEEREGKRSFRFDTGEIKADLDGVPITEPAVLAAIRDLLNENIRII